MMILMQAAANGSMSMLLMMVLIFAIMWFFMIRPQQKKQKEIQNFRNSITVGQSIVTAGGIYGVVKLIVEIAKDVRIKIDRNSVYANAAITAEKK